MHRIWKSGVRRIKQYSRPQDKWNAENGFVSKSYKLNKSVVDEFSVACGLEGVSQAGNLTRHMKEYSESIERRFNCMLIKEVHHSEYDYDDALRTLANNMLNSLKASDLAKLEEEYWSTIEKLPVFTPHDNYIDCHKEFKTEMSISEYIESGASEIIDYVTGIMLKQIVLYKLMLKGSIMPCHIRATDPSTMINIVFSGGNKLFEVTYDLLPYDLFLVMPRI